MSQLATCVCLLLLWYTVESMERERTTRLAEISYASSIRSSSLLLGKAVALAAVGAAIVLASGLAGFLVILIQGRVPFELRPIALVWGLLLFPTLLVWTAFVIAVQTITRNRYTTYAIGLGVIAFTGYRLLANEINWVGNWPLWDAVRWSDISVLELNRLALLLSRALALGMAVFFLALTSGSSDAARPTRRGSSTSFGLEPSPATWLRLLPWALFPSGRGHVACTRGELGT